MSAFLPDDVLDTSDEAEFAGYVDSGLWELEEWLWQQQCRQNLLQLHIKMLWADYFED